MNTSRLIVFAGFGAIALISESCNWNNNIHADSFQGTERINAEKERMNSLVRVGDNIFSAEEKLKENGFVISYGPKLSNVQRTRYLMIVDYGVIPGPSAYVAEAMQWRGDGKPISGVISADKTGRIFRIK